ncbi:helix-turn-helix domain-containing protein [Muricoccus vinaceus]|uniref:Helix-turn-helix domain-containing protein n=1 Tax=Muricoccus vinaceus TaxID=424704 RepID=A0ABV6IUE2_9PROT
MATTRVTKDMANQALRDIDWAALDVTTDKQIDQQIAADPDLTPISAGKEAIAARVRFVRERSLLSQPAFASRYGIPLKTLRGWEQGQRVPDATALAYLRVIEREPEAAARALTAA